MIHMGIWAVAALLMTGGVAGANAEPANREIGYPKGALGLAAIQDGDLAKAEAQLNSMKGVKASDPARLINLGQVYARTGRTAEAASAYEAALNSPRAFDVELTDGRIMSSREAARLALIELRGGYAVR